LTEEVGEIQSSAKGVNWIIWYVLVYALVLQSTVFDSYPLKKIQIGHNVQLGVGCVLAAQTGIAGSTTIGNNVHIGGQVGIAQHLNIGDGVRIAAKSGVMSNLEANGTYGGTPAVTIMEFRRQMTGMKQMGMKKSKQNL
jgi:UDP-3-O-[3-hydroxymyristoyl] glucosamine N-acyltransferase LpxD